MIVELCTCAEEEFASVVQRFRPTLRRDFALSTSCVRLDSKALHPFFSSSGWQTEFVATDHLSVVVHSESYSLGVASKIVSAHVGLCWPLFWLSGGSEAHEPEVAQLHFLALGLP